MEFIKKVENELKYYEELVINTTGEANFLFDMINEEEREYLEVEELMIDCVKIEERMRGFLDHIKRTRKLKYFSKYRQDWEDLKCEMGDVLLCLDHLISEKEKKENEE